MEKIEAALKGTRQEAESIVPEIAKTVERYGKYGGSEGRQNQLIYCYKVLRKICVVIANYKATHYDIYCDILKRAFEPHIDPTASGQYWSKYLEYWRYFHYLIMEKDLYTQASRICAHFASQSNVLINEDDYQFIMSTYFQHLLVQHKHSSYDIKSAERGSLYILNRLIDLFTAMLKCNTDLNFCYPKLLSHFIQYGLPKRAFNLYDYTESLSNTATKMFDTFFTLLAQLKTPLTSKADAELEAQFHIKAFLDFLEFDVNSSRHHSLVMKHLRACRDITNLQSNKSMGYLFCLLYYYVKFVYTTEYTASSAFSYTELCHKFSSFLDKFGVTLIESAWSKDILAAFIMFLEKVHVYDTPTQVLPSIWLKINTVEAYVAHFQLISSLIKVAGGVTESSLKKLSCCSSVRKHLILSLSQFALVAYNYFIIDIREFATELDVVDNSLLKIIRHSIDVLNSMSCSNKPYHFRYMYAQFSSITRNITTTANAKMCVTLCEMLVKVKNNFEATDWSLLLRRIYKTVLVSDDKKLMKQLHCYYIASMLHVTSQPDLAAMRNQIAIFHSSAFDQDSDMCLLELYEKSVGALKPTLEPHQKRLLHWLELQHINEYKKGNLVLRKSLISYSQTEFDTVMSVRGGKLQSDTTVNINSIYERLKSKVKTNKSLNRLEHLMFAHVSAYFLRVKTEKRPSTDATKHCIEENLEDLMQHKELLSITVSTEWLLLDEAADSLQSFEAFFYKIDTDFLCNDGAFLDWKLILDDIATIALTFNLSGYSKYAIEAWLLHYKIADTIDDHFNCLRSLTQLCASSEQMENSGKGKSFDLQKHIDRKLPFILQSIQNILPLLKRHQNYLLNCLTQLSYYYARKGNLCYTQIMMNLIESTHAELPDRADKYDIIKFTLHVVKFKILWKNLGNELCKTETDLELKQSCLLRHVMALVDQVRNVVFICSDDYTTFLILMFDFIQQIAECACNRLTDNILSGFFISILKIGIQMGLALRIVQIFSSWMMTNLQMEQITKAQTKLKLLECILGLGNCSVLKQMKKELQSVEPKTENALDEVNLCMEPIRKMVVTQLSPIHGKNLNLSALIVKQDLNRFLNCSNKLLKKHEVLEWSYFIVGCLNARLLFLAFKHDALEVFYENCYKWLQEKKERLPPENYPHVELFFTQHYVNYLRAIKKYEKALTYLKNVITKTNNMNRNLDVAYRINFLLQIQAIERELEQKSKDAADPSKPTKLRRMLEYNNSPVMLDKSRSPVFDENQKQNVKPKSINMNKAYLIVDEKNKRKPVPRNAIPKTSTKTSIADDSSLSTKKSSVEPCATNIIVLNDSTAETELKTKKVTPKRIEIDVKDVLSGNFVFDKYSTYVLKKPTVAEPDRNGESSAQKKKSSPLEKSLLMEFAGLAISDENGSQASKVDVNKENGTKQKIKNTAPLREVVIEVSDVLSGNVVYDEFTTYILKRPSSHTILSTSEKKASTSIQKQKEQSSQKSLGTVDLVSSDENLSQTSKAIENNKKVITATPSTSNTKSAKPSTSTATKRGTRQRLGRGTNLDNIENVDPSVFKVENAPKAPDSARTTRRRRNL
ncbi:protein three rows-like [Teleopsis dalmanni]|uniref:protein three rows-like n=1 Tax=Teleopsis dalmanni TaxID=139649 RepID=UPI0018CC91F8|nr:protein three rows-like [Teleopsis dalmanni]